MFDGASTPRSGPLRLAIVSTYDEMCGIAGYTRALERQLRPHADVTVLDLDQYLLRSPHRRVQRMADLHVRAVAAKLKNFDSVNIQLEYGTLGRTPWQILRRLRWLVDASPALSVTFHTVLSEDPIDWRALWQDLAKFRIGRVIGAVARHRRGRILGLTTYRMLRSRQSSHPVSVIVHTRRDARLLNHVHRLRNVDHHPLSFVSYDAARAIRGEATTDDFPLLRNLPVGAKLIGSFGFLSPYKGFETALRALRYLPDEYHLLIFGGVHPQAIQRGLSVDPYIARLLDEAHIGRTILDTIGDKGTPLSLSLDAASKALLARHPDDLFHRVHFLGVHDDEAFMRAMALCDSVVLPYLEVGQSSSGPIAIANEMGCRVLASRTQAFMQYARYHPGEIEFFDIGNYAELAGLIATGTPAPAGTRHLSLNTETNTALYLRANQPRARGTGQGQGKGQGLQLPAPAPRPSSAEAVP